MIYETLVLVHLVGVILFFGNLTAAFLLTSHIKRSKNVAVIAHTFRLVNFGDRWLTPFSIVAMLGGGMAASVQAGIPVVGTGWIFWSLVAFGISGLVFTFRVLPLQIRIARIAEEGVSSNAIDWEHYRRILHGWKRAAHLATLAAIVAVVIMVFKPAWPGL